MKKILFWSLGLVALALVALYLLSDRRLQVPSKAQFVVQPGGDPVRGKHLAGVIGCTSCHAADMGGKPSFAEDYIYALVAPDLTRKREQYSDAALLRLFRTGAKFDGQLAIGMPIDQLARMSDREAADVIAFLRSAPLAQHPVQGSSHLYPLARVALLMGEYPLPDPKDIESAAVLKDRNQVGPSRHLVSITCAECHGLDEKGYPDEGRPPLLVAKAYSLDQFRRLLHTGITITGKESASGLMSGVARSRFVHLSEEEIVGLHTYLSTGVDNEAAASLADSGP